VEKSSIVNENNAELLSEPSTISSIPEFSSYAYTADTFDVLLSQVNPLGHMTKAVELSGKELIEQQLASLLSLEPISIHESSQFQTLERDAAFQKSIERIQRELEKVNSKEIGNAASAESILGISISITAGFLVWMLRGGALLASLFSVSPLWRQFDPLPIVSHQNDKDGETESGPETSVDKLFD